MAFCHTSHDFILNELNIFIINFYHILYIFRFIVQRKQRPPPTSGRGQRKNMFSTKIIIEGLCVLLYIEACLHRLSTMKGGEQLQLYIAFSVHQYGNSKDQLYPEKQ